MIIWDEVNDSREMTIYLRTGRRLTPFSPDPPNVISDYVAYVTAIGWYKKYLKHRPKLEYWRNKREPLMSRRTAQARQMGYTEILNKIWNN